MSFCFESMVKARTRDADVEHERFEHLYTEFSMTIPKAVAVEHSLRHGDRVLVLMIPINDPAVKRALVEAKTS